MRADGCLRCLFACAGQWNDARLTALNPTLTLPNAPITRLAVAAPSGLNLAFTLALSKFSPAWQRAVGAVLALDAWPAPVLLCSDLAELGAKLVTVSSRECGT